MRIKSGALLGAIMAANTAAVNGRLMIMQKSDLRD